MKFETKVYCKKDRHREHLFLVVKLTPSAATFLIFMKKEQYPQIVNTYRHVLMT